MVSATHDPLPYSNPFYTGWHGYKMSAHVYLNGDGMGKNIHLGFFFVIIKGAHNLLLQWPFWQSVKLIIMNQNGKNITDIFQPDVQLSSCQRPGRKEMNIASGCPLFTSLEHLLSGGSMRDNCIFLHGSGNHWLRNSKSVTIECSNWGTRARTPTQLCNVTGSSSAKAHLKNGSWPSPGILSGWNLIIKNWLQITTSSLSLNSTLKRIPGLAILMC